MGLAETLQIIERLIKEGKIRKVDCREALLEDVGIERFSKLIELAPLRFFRPKVVLYYRRDVDKYVIEVVDRCSRRCFEVG